jgi:hypothetical protein
MTDRDGDDESCQKYYERIQRPQKNEVIPTWEKAPPDKDIEPDNYSYGQKGYGHGRERDRD